MRIGVRLGPFWVSGRIGERRQPASAEEGGKGCASLFMLALAVVVIGVLVAAGIGLANAFTHHRIVTIIIGSAVVLIVAILLPWHRPLHRSQCETTESGRCRATSTDGEVQCPQYRRRGHTCLLDAHTDGVHACPCGYLWSD